MRRLGKDKIKYFNSLSKKKFRTKYNKFIVEGLKIVRDLVKRHPERIEFIFSTPSQISKVTTFCDKDHLIEIDQKSMDQISLLSTSPGVFAVIKGCEIKPLLLEENEFYLYLLSTSDPGNMGSIIRTASWFGFSKIILSRDCVDPYNPKSVQASMSAILDVEIFTAEINELNHSQKNVNIFAADLEGLDYTKAQWPQSGILVMGSESHGIADSLENIEHTKITIPSYKNTLVDSINLSAATAVLLSKIASKIKD